MAYLDAASAQPPHPAARAAWAAALERGWADPSRLHAEGRRSAALLDAARAGVAQALGAHGDEVSFTSSGTTALHTGLLGLLAAAARRTAAGPARVVVSAVEHSAVLQAARAAQAAQDAEVVVVPVDRTGRVDAEAFLAAVVGDGRPEAGSPATVACLQTGNHEVGTLQPVAEVAAGCRALGVPLLVDAAQSVGRLPVPPGWSVLAASARKWGGPPGVGVLAVRRAVRWRSPWPEDEREGGRFPGAPAVPAVLAAAAALESVRPGEAAESARLSALVDRIRAEVPRLVPDVEVVGHPELRLPHLVTFSCLYVDGEALVTGLARAGHAVSSGSSCTSSTLRPSHVLEAMGVLTHGNVRVSLPYGTSEADVDAFLADLPRVVADVRDAAGVAGL